MLYYGGEEIRATTDATGPLMSFELYYEEIEQTGRSHHQVDVFWYDVLWLGLKNRAKQQLRKLV